jgi:cyclophilin family peptidyl-prolyl cis-trans isomerase
MTIGTIPTKKEEYSFVIELAPIDELPSSVHFFLELVSDKFYDDSIFVHHEKVDHIIAVPPISYTTRKVKNIDEMHDIGRSRLSYPEYSDKYQHNQYTIGFSNQGPTFYINTKINSIIHGPGGQKHHLLPNEADPCFAWIIDGFDIIDEMNNPAKKRQQEQQEHQSATKSSEQKQQASLSENGSGSWTRLVKAEII